MSKKKINLDEEIDISDDESLSSISDIESINSSDSDSEDKLEDSITQTEVENETECYFNEEDENIFEDNEPIIISDINLKVPDDERISIPVLTKYEIVRMLGIRAEQITSGSKVFIKFNGDRTPMEIAKLELEHNMIPLKIKRPLPDGRYEIWKISELNQIK